MKNKVRGLGSVIFVALLALAIPAFGQNSTLYFNGGYQGDVWCGGSEGCVATGFYDGSINGVGVGPGQSTAGMICDDYSHNINTGQTWTANGISAAALTGSNINSTQFGKTIGLAGYTELAYLVNQMFTTNPSSTQQSYLSQAIWYITGGVTWAQLSSGAQSLVNTVLALYKSNSISLSQFANLWIYTPTDQSANGPQEMWGEVVAAEGGAALLYLLLAAVACFGAMLHSRKQRVTV